MRATATPTRHATVKAGSARAGRSAARRRPRKRRARWRAARRRPRTGERLRRVQRDPRPLVVAQRDPASRSWQRCRRAGENRRQNRRRRRSRPSPTICNVTPRRRRSMRATANANAMPSRRHRRRQRRQGNERDRARACTRPKRQSDQHAAVKRDRNCIVEQRLAFDDRRKRLGNFQSPEDRHDGDRIGRAENSAGE